MDNQDQASQNFPPNPIEPLQENKTHFSFLTKKLFLIILAILVLFTFIYAVIYFNLPTPVPANQKLNENISTITLPSKLIVTTPFSSDMTTNWKVYVNEKARLSFKYPPYIELVEEVDYYPKNTTLSVEVVSIADLPPIYDGPFPLGQSQASANKTKALLDKGIGCDSTEYDCSNSVVFKMGEKYALSTLSLGHFDTCDVNFARKVYFYNDNYQITLTLVGSTDAIAETIPQYIKQNSGTYCWITQESATAVYDKDSDSKHLFAKDLVNGKAPKVAQDWFNVVDKVLSTLTFIF